jgi:cold shock CspA family protein
VTEQESRSTRIIGTTPPGTKVSLKISVIRGVASSTLMPSIHGPRAFGTRPRFSQPRFQAPSGSPISSVVKWFSPEKGFGFVEISDGSGDASLHGSLLAQSGIGAVQSGETLEVCVGPGQKGPHVTEVLSVDSSSAALAPRGSSFRHIGTGHLPTRRSTRPAR